MTEIESLQQRIKEAQECYGRMIMNKTADASKLFLFEMDKLNRRITKMKDELNRLKITDEYHFKL